MREYRSIVGVLFYVCHTRPDVAFSVNKVAQFMQAPYYGLVFSAVDARLSVKAFSDADWAGDRRSMFGYGVFVGDCLVAWALKK
ncbi:uncharacterized mitochondrial protein AtMg00810-like [Hibiscus syriacus]|uniref:uncharacterized mitochondrial protein AtMg00810-like n=1 Tax=Hibiscus syriacus TaxID=106335 RepID=UPI001921FE99|nr:uncharacterized mitochondrial protein AtMg00810-like [Hibiscus syriacus]